VVACSATKQKVAGPVPAWHLYDGVAFRVLNRALRGGTWPLDLDVVILSAKYGLIDPTTVIESYDEVMTEPHAAQLQHGVHRRLNRLICGRGYQELLIFAGRTYLRAIRLAPVWYPAGLEIRVAPGPIGRKLGCLRSWLHEPVPVPFLTQPADGE
jgi:hypothetical protein